MSAPTGFESTFDTTENPYNPSLFNHGGSVGLDWQDCRSANGRLFGVGTQPSGYDDCIMLLKPGIVSATSQYARATLYKAGVEPENGQEAELFLFGNMSANSITGYECLFSRHAAFQFMCWKGAIQVPREITATDHNGGILGYDDGDTLEAIGTIVGGNPHIEVFQNGVLKKSMTDTDAGKVTSGCPGAAFFARPGANLSMENFCFTYLKLGTYP